MASVFNMIQDSAAEITGMLPENITPSTSMKKMRALDRAALVIACEKRYRMTIHDEDVWDFETLGDLALYIQEHLNDGRDNFAAPTDADRDAWYYE